MGLRDALRGRAKATPLDLGNLAALPTMAAALRSAGQLSVTGSGAVCVKPPAGDALAGFTDQVQQLLARQTDDGTPRYVEITDELGHTWLTRDAGFGEVSAVSDELHAINSTLAEAGFGSSLVCSLVAFTSGHGPAIGMVYRPARAAWYPFAPTGENRRDNARELQIREWLGDAPYLEKDLTRWFPVWGAPGL